MDSFESFVVINLVFNKQPDGMWNKTHWHSRDVTLMNKFTTDMDRTAFEALLQDIAFYSTRKKLKQTTHVKSKLHWT